MPIESLENFYARIPNIHPQKLYIDTQLKNIKTGQHGETKLQRFLDEVSYQNPPLVIRNFITRVHSKRTIQIDYLLVTRKYILLIEVKNIAGHIKFHATPPQIIRTSSDGTSQAMDCPFIQLDRNLDGFKKIFPLIEIPVYTSVVWANPSAKLEVPFAPPHPLIPLKKLPLVIQELEKNPDIFSPQQFKNFKKKVLATTVSFQNQSHCDRYGIHPKELVPGLYCSQCYSALTKKFRTWICDQCGNSSSSELFNNIFSQFMIQKSSLTIAEIRKQLPSLSAKYIRNVLNEEGYQSAGKTKSKQYWKKRK